MCNMKKIFFKLHKNRIYQKYPTFFKENIRCISMIRIGDIYQANPDQQFLYEIANGQTDRQTNAG